MIDYSRASILIILTISPLATSVKEAMMFKILKHITCGEELLKSQLFNECTFDQSFRQDIKNARKHVVIESPFLTERRARFFAPIFKTLSKRKVKIRLNTRHPRFHNPEMKMQAEAAAKILLVSGVNIYTYDDLQHRKLAIVDNKILWEGSMNILSHGQSKEIMRHSTSARLCREMIHFSNIYH